MGADIYLSTDEESRKKLESEHRGVPLPPLPDSHLFGLGGYPLLLDAVSRIATELRGTATSAGEQSHQDNYLAFIDGEHADAARAAEEHLQFVRSWADVTGQDSRVALVTPAGASIKTALERATHPDARVFWGRALFEEPPKTPDENLLLSSAVLWVYQGCAGQLEIARGAGRHERAAFQLAAQVTRSIGIHALYARRYGGNYVISI